MNDCVCISWRKLKNRSDVYERASVITEGLDRELKACLFGRKGALVSLGLILLTLGWREEYHRLPTQSCAESRTSGHGVSLSVPYHQPVFPQSISSLVPFVSVAFFFFHIDKRQWIWLPRIHRVDCSTATASSLRSAEPRCYFCSVPPHIQQCTWKVRDGICILFYYDERAIDGICKAYFFMGISGEIIDVPFTDTTLYSQGTSRM